MANIRAVIALLLLVVVKTAAAVGTVAVIPKQTVYQCYAGGSTLGAPYLADKTAACAAFFVLAHAKGQALADVSSSTADCSHATTFVNNGLTYTSTTVDQPLRTGLPAGWCGNGATYTGTYSFFTGVANVCPANADGTPTSNPTTCVCSAGYKPDATATSCIPDCTANVTASTGYYDIGASQGASPQLLGCAGKCEAIFDGVSPAGSAMVGGQKHWFAKGSYIQTGNACQTGVQASQVGNGSAAIPQDSCGAGQAKGTVNGKAVCVDQSGDGKRQTPSSTDSANSKTDKKTVTNADGSTTTTETTTKTDANGNKQTTTTTTTTSSDGKTIGSTTTTTGSASDSNSKPSDQQSQCQQNPSAAGCGGDPAVVDPLYQARQKTFQTVLSAQRDALMASPVGTALGGFFTVSGGGSCPTWQANLDYFKTTIVIDQFCADWARTALAVFKVALLVAASFFAFRVAIE